MSRLPCAVLLILVWLLAGCAAADRGTPPPAGDDGGGTNNPAAITIDHRHTDVSRIPTQWINAVKSTLRIHYAHTSHGEQITAGLESLAAGQSRYAFYPDNCRVPEDSAFLRLMDGQMGDWCETYITPELYWKDQPGLDLTRRVLNRFTVEVSTWAWCTQLDDYSAAEAREYLDAMAQLEKEFPGVTFVYMTGNAQSPLHNRYERNEEIRAFCRQNGKVLFDFADLDCWFNGDQHMENGVPCEHPRFHGDEAGHTTLESCRLKAGAFWWLLARLSGWDGESG